jgi:murein L,D-transpeptidase YcbB/YkuD
LGVVAAVRRFQARHGLAPDGVVGATTLAALNVSVAERTRRMALNLERWRWLPRALGPRYLMVNSTAFRLDVVEGGRVTLSRRVIVGRTDWPTPIVSARATGFAFSPVWNVPRDIAAQEILPRVRARRDYLARERIRVFAGAVEVSPDTIDWSAVTESTFAFRFVQAPGRGNPLGGVKLLLSNPFNVSLHDTPLPELFDAPVRTFSHGCVRVEGVAELAAHLLPPDSLWPADSIAIAMADTAERVVGLPQAVPVYFAYWTAWVDEDGIVQFRDDVYGWDARLAKALHVGSLPQVSLSLPSEPLNHVCRVERES